MCPRVQRAMLLGCWADWPWARDRSQAVRVWWHFARQSADSRRCRQRAATGGPFRQATAHVGAMAWPKSPTGLAQPPCPHQGVGGWPSHELPCRFEAKRAGCQDWPPRTFKDSEDGQGPMAEAISICVRLTLTEYCPATRHKGAIYGEVANTVELHSRPITSQFLAETLIRKEIHVGRFQQVPWNDVVNTANGYACHIWNRHEESGAGNSGDLLQCGRKVWNVLHYLDADDAFKLPVPIG